jgi:hypothetical protein
MCFVSQLMRDLPGLNQNVREPPFCLPYCAKVRVLLTAHFSRKEFPPKTLELGELSVVVYSLVHCVYVRKLKYLVDLFSRLLYAPHIAVKD